MLISIGGNDRTILIWMMKGGIAETKRQMFMSKFIKFSKSAED